MLFIPPKYTVCDSQEGCFGTVLLLKHAVPIRSAFIVNQRTFNINFERRMSRCHLISDIAKSQTCPRFRYRSYIKLSWGKTKPQNTLTCHEQTGKFTILNNSIFIEIVMRTFFLYFNYKKLFPSILKSKIIYCST